MIIPVILAGGIGTRLWPLSRRECPKQFAKLFGDRTLFQDTLIRINSLYDHDMVAPIVICGYEHRDMVLQQLAELNITNAYLILEPVGRSTAPAVAVAAMLVLRLFADASLLVLPADHAIASVDQLHDAILIAEQYALADYLVCFGVKPTTPATGYGYIKIGEPVELEGLVDSVSSVTTDMGSADYVANFASGNGFLVDHFVEKPNQEVALGYLQSQQYYWNGGMFMLRAQSYLDELRFFAGDIFNACQNVVASMVDESDVSGITGNHVFRLGIEEFAACRSDSIDYAIMEHTKKAVVVPLVAGWNDVGSWLSLWEHGAKDVAENVTIGDVVAKDSVGSYIHATNRKIVVLGVENYVVVETKDTVLIVPKDRCQEIKGIVEQLTAV